MLARVHVIVSGRVQGVAFRWYAQREAEDRGLTGWVRNRRNGRVEVCVEGERSEVAEFAEWMRRGPMLARVDEVEETWAQASGEFADFQVRSTA
jgi:acylphosphatase